MSKGSEKPDPSLLSEENVKKHVLPEYNLQYADISRVKFKDTDKQRAVYKVENCDKAYCLKKMYFNKSSLLFVYSAVEWLHRNGINVPNILATNKRGRFVCWENMFFILTPWIDGEKCSYDNIEQVLASTENLARMHKVSERFRPIEGSEPRYTCHDLKESTNKHFEQLLSCSNSAFKYKDKFSGLFLKHFEENALLARTAAQLCSDLNNDMLQISLCHLDYVNKNIIFDSANKIWNIDFDKCSIDYCVHDISYFLRRMLKRDNTHWDLEVTINCLNNYEKVRPLNFEEYRYILAYLAFPQKFWKISRDYYNNIKKCNHSSFYSILLSTIEKNSEQLDFTLKFKEYIEDKFKKRLC